MLKRGGWSLSFQYLKSSKRAFEVEDQRKSPETERKTDNKRFAISEIIMKQI
jgi:hypothetical protein